MNIEKTDDLVNEIMDGLRVKFSINLDSDLDDEVYTLIHNTITEFNKTFTLIPIKEVKTEDQARELAVDWQNWSSEQALSHGELAEYQVYFVALADKFNLIEEFSENGII
jgi:hypothetical protein